jgi:hypothetical protein
LGEEAAPGWGILSTPLPTRLGPGRIVIAKPPIGVWRDRTARLPRHTPAGRRIAVCPATYSAAFSVRRAASIVTVIRDPVAEFGVLIEESSSQETPRWREMDSNYQSPVKEQLVETVLFDFSAEARKGTIGGRRSQPRDLGGDLRRDYNLRDDNDRHGWGRRQTQNGGSPASSRSPARNEPRSTKSSPAI